MLALPEKKKRKTEQKKDSSRLQCGYFMPKKNRLCAMTRRADQKYCSEHMIYDTESEKNEGNGEKSVQTDIRVPCPYDGNHTVWSKSLKKHMKKCNAKPVVRHEVWFVEDINCSLRSELYNEEQNEVDQSNAATEKASQSPDSKSEEDSFKKYLSIVQNTHFEPLQFKISEHIGLHERLEIASRQKHAKQQSSLIGNLRDANLLSSNNFFVEFGCGKGELSRFVNLCILEDAKAAQDKSKESVPESTHYGYGFIDRGVNRMKMDQKILKDSRESNTSIIPRIQRTRIDIKDLDLNAFIDKAQPEKVVGISKHLCGAATDLTLKSLLNSTLLNEDSSKFGGLLIAMCCRHVCSYDQLLPQSREFLAERGFGTASAFSALQRMVSWAVCGKGSSKGNGKQAEEDGSENDEEIDENTNSKTPEDDPVENSNLTFEEREELGIIARRLIDESRVYALKSILKDNYDIEMFWYVPRDVTLENVCLFVAPKAN
ncbi:methyltransferase TRM13-domain-containing protein [Scheffersomyces xylosifermentans]|uniref:methyltransferase TRM13-domain-containing protein n=1 Tax=Scheffersomyces xylosifermentans TaxID=1304137 RepID=UPI00315D01C5